jgi:hypothetical protein
VPPGTAHFLLSRAFRRLYAAIAGKTKKTREEATAFLLLPPPGTGELTQPSRSVRPPGTVPGGPGTARFTKALELKKRRSARYPRVAALVQLHPPKPPPRPAGGSHCLGYHLGRAGGWQGPPEGPIARARQLGSPSARRTLALRNPGPWGHTGGAGSPRTRFFFCESPFVHI